jgi:hypothetical protein
MGWKRKLLVVLLVLAVIIGAGAAYVYPQYKRLQVDVDQPGSGISYAGVGEFQVRVVLRFTNDGAVRLYLPPTDFSMWIDGIYAGPGDTVKGVVPAHGSTTTTAIVTVSQSNAAQAFWALADAGKDTILVKGRAHLSFLGVGFDYPFDGTFSVSG